jgi:hypothetical protein
MSQTDWRFCGRCKGLFFDGATSKGVCPAGGAHAPFGFNFDLPADIPASATTQAGWRFCKKCFLMFFGASANQGICPAGTGHDGSSSFDFVLPHDVPETGDAQGGWRFCDKCFVMFFDSGADKGVCAAHGGHSDQHSGPFVLPHHDEVQTFDVGPLTSDLPLGGSAHVELSTTGAFTFSTHAHDSGAESIDYTLCAVLISPSGFGFVWTHQGHVEGTSSAIPLLGRPKRDDNQTSTGTNATVAGEFGKMFNSTLFGRLAETDTLTGGPEALAARVISDAAKQLGLASISPIFDVLKPG